MPTTTIIPTRSDFKISTLDKEIHYLDTLIKDLEQAFSYRPSNKIDVDFYPLFHKEDLNQNYILIDDKEKKLIGHIGARQKLMGKEEVSVIFLGGIFINPKFQGQGHFRRLFEYVLNIYKKSTLLFLWSDHHDLYKKFGFTLQGTQIEIPPQTHKQISTFNQINSIEKTKLKNLSENDLQTIKDLYEKEIFQNFFAVKRTDKDWQLLKKIHSSDLYLKRKNNNIVAYAFANKGQDMPDIIHEFVSKKEVRKEFHNDISFLTLWTSDLDFLPLGTPQGLALIRNNKKESFSLEKKSPIFISGLDSI